MITSTSLSREGLLALLGGKLHPQERRTQRGLSLPKAGQVTAVWETEDTGLPQVLVVPTDELKELYAFALTYVSNYAPFSAFFRVVADEMAEMFVHEGPPPATELVRAGLAMSVAEACIHLDGRRWEEVPLQACLATQSAVGTAVLSAGYNPFLAFAAMRRWHHVRSLMHLDQLRVDADRIEWIWSHLLAWGGSELPTSSNTPVEDNVVALLESFRSPLRDSADVLAAVGDGKVASHLMDFRDLPREERVRMFDNAAILILNSPLKHWQKEVMIGGLAAQVADGSFRYLELAMQHRDHVPHSAVWFSIFTSLSPETDLLSVAGNLVARLERKLPTKGTIFSPIAADMSYEECVMLAAEGRIGRVRTEQQSVLQVELFPAISGRFRLDRESRRDSGYETPVNQAQIAAIRRIAHQLISAVSELEDSRQRVERRPRGVLDLPKLEDLFGGPDGVPPTTPPSTKSKRTKGRRG